MHGLVNVLKNSRFYPPLLFILLVNCLSSEAQIDTALFSAIQRCDLAGLQRLESSVADINAVDRNGANALMWAVYHCDLTMVKELVRHGARAGDSAVIYFSNGNLENGYFGSLQTIAASRGKLAIIKYLADSLHLPLEEGEFNPFTRKKEGWTPLTSAAYYGYANIVAYLLQEGRHKSTLYRNERFEALLAAVKTFHWDVFDRLMKEGFEKELGNQAAFFLNTKARFEKEYLGKTNAGTARFALEQLYRRKPGTLEMNMLQKILLLKCAVELAKAYVGQEHPLYASNLAEQASLNELDVKKAVSFSEQLAIQKRILGDTNIAYATMLCNMGISYKHDSQYEQALSLFLEALPVQKKVYGEESILYAACLNNLATIYGRLKQQEQALLLLQQASAIMQKAKAEEHPAYAVLLADLARLHMNRGYYNQALPLLQQAVEIRRKNQGDVHAAIVSKWNSLSGLFYCMLQYRKGDVQTPDWKELLKEIPPDYVASLFDLGSLYITMGRLKEAFPLFQEALTTTKRFQGEQHPVYVICLNNLAELYIGTGQYEKALPLLQQALLLTRKTLGENHMSYARGLNNLSDLYTAIGQYEKALPLLLQALAIRKDLWGEDHSEYSTNLNSLATLFQRMGQNDKALSSLLQAVSIDKKIGGEEHPNYGRSINNLANFYRGTGQYEKALPLYEQAAAITKKKYGEDHTAYAMNITNLAELLVIMGNFEQAQPLFEKALSSRKKILGEENVLYTRSLINLGWVYTRQGRIPEAIPYSAAADSLTLAILAHTYTSLSEKEKMGFLDQQSTQFSFLPSLSYLQHTTEPALMKQLYANELALKGMVLQDQEGVFRSIQRSGNSSVINLYGQWRTNKSLIGKQLLLPAGRRLPHLDSLQEITNQLEQELSRRAVSFRNAVSSQSITARSISQKLRQKQAAVEFIRFRLHHKQWTDTILYAALVLLPGDSICKFVPLCEERQLKRLTGRPAAIRTSGPLNDSLYALVWKPLEQYLAGSNTVYYAPTGLLHRIAFQSLHADSTHLLINKYRLNQLLSTRSIAVPDSVDSKPATAAVWGNIDYDTGTKGAMAARGLPEGNGQTDTVSSFGFYNADTRGLRNQGWPALSGTRQEIDSITHMLMQAGIRVTVNSSATATEEAFKALDGRSPAILHLATHGFFLPVTENKINNTDPVSGREAFSAQQNPLFRSGLVLAGGNHTWKGEPALPGKEDGILTAYEIAQMDLSNTALVVLSACETGLGDIQSNEGVFGLQRAFKMAGVKQLIVSLWKVPDAETTELMTLFYRNWLGGQTTREALRSAQLKMMEKYPPEKWAAFVLVE